MDSLKYKTEQYRIRCLDVYVRDSCNFWDLSNAVLKRIEGHNYVGDKSVQVKYICGKEKVYLSLLNS